MKSTPSGPSTDNTVPTLILSGHRGAGKSSLLIDAISDVTLGHPEWSGAIRGVVSRGVHNDRGYRTGFDAQLFPSRRIVPLARVTDLERVYPSMTGDSGVPPREYTLAASPDPIPSDLETFPLGPFQFFRSAFAAAEAEILEGFAPLHPDGSGAPDTAGDLDRSGDPPARLVVIDEIGPLELHRFDGFHRLLSHLLSTRVALVLTVRPDLLENVMELCRTAPRRRVQSVTIGSDGDGIAIRGIIVTFIEKEII
ncbi:MAG: hypothetical protein ACLFSV_07220 [Alkalispirochaeta sp.]